MSSNRSHPQYHPPQQRYQYSAPQQYSDPSYSRPQQQKSEPYNQPGYAPAQRQHVGNGYQEYDQYGYNNYDENAHYAQNEQWNPGQYQDPRTQNFNGPPVAQRQPAPHSRTYQYDERFHADRSQSHSEPAGETFPPNRGPRQNRGAGMHEPRPKLERILTDKPPSPKAVAWDNPFGAFPKHKKDQERKNPDSSNPNDERKVQHHATVSSGRSNATDSRPPTSQEQAFRAEQHRPNTSQSYQTRSIPQSASYTSPTTEIPPRQDSRPQEGVNTLQGPGSFDFGLPGRPAPHRATTEPVFQQRNQRPPETFDEYSYRGVPLRKPISRESESEVPNFEALQPGTTEAVENAVTMQKQVYQKQTYKAAEPSDSQAGWQVPQQQQQYETQYSEYPQSQKDSRNVSTGPSFQHPYNKPPPGQPPQQQRPQGRPPPEQSRSAVSQGYQAAPQRREFDFNNPDYGQDYAFDQGFNPHGTSERDFRKQSHSPEARRQGYDQRLQPNKGSSLTNPEAIYREPAGTNQQNQTINPAPPDHFQDPRPHTSSSNYPAPTRPFTERSASYDYRSNTSLPYSDASHPIPVRPGLMSPPPSQQPRQQPPPTNPVPHQQQLPLRPRPGSRDENQPITIAELNNMREAFRADPNNHQLGLKFAKRLVEAARVLANEGGTADPKQTQKNRERYIFDAHKVIKKLVSAGSPEAMFYLADCYGQGQLGLEPDPREAYNLYQSAAKLGHAQSAYRVAVCCELGTQEGGGTRRDHMKAVQFYKRAATLGDTPAMFKMGMILLKGLLGHQQNRREAISWLKRAAERADAENPHALHELGLLYETASPQDVVVRDEAYAYQLFRQAADLGYKHSQSRLGSAFEYGLLGCPIDPRSSIAWYTKAAAQGEHQAEFALSGWYLTGSPPLLEQSDTEAYLWAKKAAVSGLAKAEYAMGYYTEVGIGVVADLEAAKRWYYAAAAQNHPKAKERLDELKRGGARMQKRIVNRSNVGRQNEGECSVM